MGTFNKVILIGRLGRKPEVSYTQSGTAKGVLNIATDHRWVDGEGNQQSDTNWTRVIAWGQMAENANKHLDKGRLVAIDGRLETRSYDKDGQTRYITEVIINRGGLQYLDSKGAVAADAAGADETPTETETGTIPTEDSATPEVPAEGAPPAEEESF